MAVVIAIDAGTTGVRSLAFDDHGRVVGSSHRELTQHYPKPGWVEHDAEEIWDGVRSTLRQVVDQVAQAVAAIGITNQRETAVAWDRKSGRPLHRAIVWQDRRTARRCEELGTSGCLPLIRSSTGLVLDPYFTATKFEWLLNHGVELGPDLALGTVDSWLVWNLTGGPGAGVHATDVSNASRTLLYDIGSGQWSSELLSLFSVPQRSLPEVAPSSGRFGVTSTEGLPLAIPVSGVAGDQQAALFGQACFQRGMAKNTYGTGSFLLLNAGETPPTPVEGLLTTVAWQLSGQTVVYALEGSIFATGAAIQWLRDGLGAIHDASDTGPLASSVDDTAGAYLVPAFTGLGSPWWDPYARGTIVGLSRGVSRAHLARAAVESMAYQTRDVMDAMVAATGQPPGGLRVDGGASVMDLLMQIQADQLQLPVSRAATAESTALGAAHLAGLAEGVWSSQDELAESWSAEATFWPEASADHAEKLHRGWRQALERSRSWASA